MPSIRVIVIALLLASASDAQPASAQCYRSFPSLTNGPNGDAPNAVGSEVTNPGCDQSARQYPNSFGTGAVANPGGTAAGRARGCASPPTD